MTGFGWGGGVSPARKSRNKDVYGIMYPDIHSRRGQSGKKVSEKRCLSNYLFLYSQTTTLVVGGGIPKKKVSIKQCILTFTD